MLRTITFCLLISITEPPYSENPVSSFVGVTSFCVVSLIFSSEASPSFDTSELFSSTLCSGFSVEEVSEFACSLFRPFTRQFDFLPFFLHLT